MQHNGQSLVSNPQGWRLEFIEMFGVRVGGSFVIGIGKVDVLKAYRLITCMESYTYIFRELSE